MKGSSDAGFWGLISLGGAILIGGCVLLTKTWWGLAVAAAGVALWIFLYVDSGRQRAEKVVDGAPTVHGDVVQDGSKRPTILLVGALIATLWIAFAFYSFLSATSGMTAVAEQIGAAIAGTLIIPFLLIASLGLLFNWLGWALKKRGFAITAGVLYCVSLLGISYTFGLVPSIVLTFIGVAKLKQ